MLNSTTPGWKNLPVYTLYTIQGSVICGSNLVVVIAILRHEALRTSKEYLLMLFLSLADSCNMAGFLSAGIYRIYLIFTDQHADLVTAFDCATVVHNLLLILGVPWANIMLLIVSLDRLICVSFPLDYIGFTRSYSLRILTPGFSFAFLYGLGYVMMARILGGEVTDMPAPCVTYTVLKVAPPTVSLFYQSVPSSFAFMSVLVYVLVWYKHKKHSQIDIIQNQANAEELKRQNRVTATLAMSCMFTCVLFCIPMVVANIILSLGHKGYSLYFYLLSTFNPLCNVFLYQIRHREMRLALTKLFNSQALPIDIRMWSNVGATQQSQQQQKQEPNESRMYKNA